MLYICFRLTKKFLIFKLEGKIKTKWSSRTDKCILEMSKLHLTLNISCSHVTCRLKRSWFPFRRSEPTASNTCWNARSGRSTLLTWKACVWASTTWAPWTFPRTTTDEGPLFLPPPSSCSPPGATVCLRTPHLSFDLTWQCRCSQLLMPFLKHTLKNEKRKKKKERNCFEISSCVFSGPVSQGRWQVWVSPPPFPDKPTYTPSPSLPLWCHKMTKKYAG